MKQRDSTPKRVIMWGATGQAKVVRPILEQSGIELVALFDDTPGLAPPFVDVPLFEGRRDFPSWISKEAAGELGFVVAIGNPHGRVRLQLQEYLMGFGLEPVSVIHPTAWVEPGTIIGAGAQVMAGAIILAEVTLGDQCIVNTRASVDHESVLADGVEIAPGATLCGLVRCETNAWVCAGATVLPRMRIGADAIVGAGAVVRSDIPAATKVVGVPARPIGHTTVNSPAPRFLKQTSGINGGDDLPAHLKLIRTPE